MMTDKGEAARELGITLTMSDDGKESFVGKHLGTVDIREGEASAAVALPKEADEKKLVEDARALGLGVSGAPLLYVVAGGYILYNPLPGLAALTLLLGCVLLAEAVVLAILALRLRPAPGWGLWLFDALVTLALAIFILVKWPGNSVVILAAFVGVSMIWSGVSRLIFGSTVRGAIPKAA